MNDRVHELEASTEFAEEMLIAEIQSALEELLEEKGFNRADLAKKMGVTKARVTQIFSDTQNFTVRLIARAFHALGEKAVFDHEPLDAAETKCLGHDKDQHVVNYLVGELPPTFEPGRWLYPDWHECQGGIFIAGWPESEELGDALHSYIRDHIPEPPKSSKRDRSKAETPSAIAEWVESSNVLPFRKERLSA